MFWRTCGFIMSERGFYPYEWVDSDDKLKHVRLPNRKVVYSTLTRETISEDDYKHAKTANKKLECKCFKDYHMT